MHMMADRKNKEHLSYELPVFNQDDTHVYSGISNENCVESTRKSDVNSSNRENIQDRNLRKISNYKCIVVLLTVVISHLVSIGLTYTVTSIFTREDCSVKNLTTTFTIGQIPRVRLFSAECPFEWIKTTSSCLYVSGDKKQWLQAIDLCRSMGSDLVSFSNLAEEEIISRQLKSGIIYWIGLHDLDRDGRFQWSDGTMFNYTNWRKDEPNRYRRMELCVELDANRVWNDINCNLRQNYICKRELATQCGTGPWIFFNNSCYLFNTDSPFSYLSWNNSRKYCKEHGAELAIIKSREKLSFLLTHSSRQSTRWIGLHNGKGLREYKWTDDAVSLNLPWQPYHPNTTFINCVALQGGFFMSEQCDSRHGYICEKHL